MHVCGTPESPRRTCSNEHLLKSVHLLQVNTDLAAGVQNSEPKGSAEQPSGENEQGAAGGQGSNGHCEVCESAGHSKEACPVVKAAQQGEEKEAAQQEDEAGWQTVPRNTKPCKTESKSKKSKGKGKKKKGHKGKGDAAAVVTVGKDGTIIR